MFKPTFQVRNGNKIGCYGGLLRYCQNSKPIKRLNYFPTLPLENLCFFQLMIKAGYYD